ncbi:MAG: septal ring lytic transglycosylase RlpA family protein [Polaromonas sp.]
MHKGVIQCWATTSLLALLTLLTACTTLPSPPSPSPSGPAVKAKVRSETSGTVDAAPVPGAAADNKELLAGEAGRELERGQASWYGPRFHGRRTANGERYDMHALTAAHKTLPFGTLVRVRSLVTGREVDVRINDRGPFGPGRVIDLSRAAAEALGMLGLGVKEVLLLVPESTPPLAELPPQPVKKARRITRRALAVTSR